VVDATSVRAASRAPLVELARRWHLPTVALVFDLPLALCEARRGARADRDAGPDVLLRQREQLHREMESLDVEGHAVVHVMRTPEEVAALRLVGVPLPPDRRRERGPFDVIGDVHGCADELESLLARLGYAPGAADGAWRHAGGRRAVFVGDLVDRGPRIVDTLRLAMDMADAGSAFVVPGNHDDKLLRKLQGRTVQVAHGLELTLAELAHAPPEFARRVRAFLEALPSHLVLDGGALVVSHAGLPRALHGRESRHVRDRALFGETTGVPGADGLPMRIDWAAEYRGRALVAFGHTPVLAPRWKHETVDLDTGCVFGGALTALRWPERELVAEPARRQYAVPGRAIAADPFVSREVARSERARSGGARSDTASPGTARSGGARLPSGGVGRPSSRDPNSPD
jgi:protein phosphatase